MEAPTTNYLTPQQANEYARSRGFNGSARSWRRWAQNGDVAARYDGRGYLIPQTEIVRVLDARGKLRELPGPTDESWKHKQAERDALIAARVEAL